MHQRFLPWVLIGVLFTALTLRVHAAEPGKFKSPGKILVAKADKATKTVGSQVTPLSKDMDIEQSAKINTEKGGSVVLVFSSGATTRIGEDSELVIEEFLQDPFAETVKVKDAVEEPSPSRTRLALNKGELVGDVKKLRLDQNSEFTVKTPVGAAGVRGTVFRIVFRPDPNNPNKATFQLTTTSGLVQNTVVTATGTSPGVQIPQGQQIDILVDVTFNAQGQMVVTAIPPPTPNTAIPPGTMADVTKAAVEIAGAVQNAVFSPPTGGGPPPGSVSGPVTTTTNFNANGNKGTIQTEAIPAGQIMSKP
jgi:hypothetical protein